MTAPILKIYPWYYKQIGTLKPETLKFYKQYMLGLTDQDFEVASPDFNQYIISVKTMCIERDTTEIVGPLFEEMSEYFDIAGHKFTNVARLAPNQYMFEHSDWFTKTKDPHIFFDMAKIHIPIFTNEMNGMMWKPTKDVDKKYSNVVNFKEGGIYIVDNLRPHSVVNLSSSHRYFITTRFNIDGYMKNRELLAE